MEDIVPQNTPYSNLPTTSGVYKITCTANKKFYIGSAINLRQRRYMHFYNLSKNKHENPKLQNAWNKYGEQSFTFEILELVLPMSLTAREQYWFNKLKPFGNKGFNIALEAGSSFGIKHSPERIEKNRQSQLGKKRSPESIEKSRQGIIGKKRSPEAIEKTRLANIGKKRSPEARENMRQAAIGKKWPLEATEKARLANLGKKRTPEHIEQIRKAHIGTKHTSEHIEKTRQASKQASLTRKRREDGTFA